MDEKDPVVQALPQMAAHHASTISDSIDLASEQLSKTSGWLLATLLAVNGGAALAVLQSGALLPATAHCLWWFGGGLFTAIANAYSLQYLYGYALPRMKRLRSFWQRVAIEGEYLDEELDELYRPIQRMRWTFGIPQMLGFASAACFLTGGILFVRAVRHVDAVLATAS